MNLKNILLVIMVVLFIACGEESTESNSDNTISLSKGLVAHYEFEGNAKDSSGNGNHGKEYGGVSYVDGVKGKAIAFDGINDYIEVKDDNSLDLINQFSISLWINPEENQKIFAGLVDKSHATNKGASSWVLQQASGVAGKYYLGYFNGNPWSNDYGNDYFISTSTNTWNHLVVIKNKNIVLYYLDGILVSKENNNDTTSKNNNLPLWIGAVNGQDRNYNGKMDDLRIYNRVLNESEVKELYNLKSNNPVSFYKGDATKDFSTQHNPNNEWSYGMMTTSFTGFKLSSITNFEGMEGWMRDTLSNIWINSTSAIKYGIRPNELTLHPSSGEAPAVLRWTAPNII